MSPLRALLLVLPGWAVGWAIALLFPDTVIAGDPPIYLERMEAIEAGGIPYADPVFEHLPVMLVPMYAARILSGFGGEFAYTVVFSLLMAGAVAATATVLDRSSAGSGGRFLVLSAPLLPLVVFRNDPVAVIAAVVAFVGASAASRRWAGVAGVLAKGWPVALVPIGWRRGERRTAVWWGVAGAVAAGIMLLPGFRGTQESGGLHAETVGGSLVGLVRALTGADPGVEWTTAVYLDAPAVAYVVGPVVAAILVVRSLRRRTGEGVPAWAVAAGLTAAVILASPLFSAQYVFWLLPFFALDPERRWTLSIVSLSTLSLVPVLWFDAQLSGASWWWGAVLLRNALLVALAWTVTRPESPSAVRSRPARG